MGELTSVLQDVHVPCWIIDEGGVFTWVNTAFIATFGDRLGDHFSTIVAPESLEAAARHFEKMRVEDPAAEIALDMMLPDGTRVRTEVSSVFLESIGLCCGGFGLAGKPTRRPAPRTVLTPELTPRQHEILLLLSEGASTDHIASELHLSRETVRNHIRQILRHLHVHSRLAAVARARALGLIAD